MPGAEYWTVAMNMLQSQVVDGFELHRIPVQPLDFDVFFIGDIKIFEDLMQSAANTQAA